jgi:hypothetical protein
MKHDLSFGYGDIQRKKPRKRPVEEHKRCPWCDSHGWPCVSDDTPAFSSTPLLTIRCQNFRRCHATGPVRKTERGAWAAWDSRA